jgi:hypothetical protein
MIIDMSKRINEYMRDPSRYSVDILHQEGVWRDNLIFPYGTCYSFAFQSMKRKLEDAKLEAKKAEEEAKRIREMGMAICLFVLDVAASSAITKIAGSVSRMQSPKSIDFFLSTSQTSTQAITKFLQQSQTFSDMVIGNLANKTLDVLKNKVFLDSFKSETKKLESTVTMGLLTQGVTDPLVLQNNMLVRYGKSLRSVNALYVNSVRNAPLDDNTRRQVLTWLATLPIVRPPTRGFPAKAMSEYLEVLLWLNACYQAGTQPQKGAAFGRVDWRMGEKMNETFAKMTGRYITNNGSAVGNPGAGGFRMAWDGHIGPYHHQHFKTISNTAAGAIQNILKNMY